MFNYDPAQVRPKFRARYCHAVTLPSGELCDYELYPITDDEVRELTKELDEKPDCIGKQHYATESEWLLWTALRMKYGLSYMATTNTVRRERIVEYYEPKPPAQPDVFDYIDGRFNVMIQDIFSDLKEEKPKEKPKKKNKKYIDFDLTGEEKDTIIYSKP